MNIADSLRDIAVADLDLSRFVSVEAGTYVAETIERMNAAERSSAFVVQDGSLMGIFTQRDVMTRVLGVEGACGLEIEEVMTPQPRSIVGGASVSEAMALMSELWVRSIPVLDEGRVLGNFSYYSAMTLIAELLADRAGRAESDLSAQHGLLYIDFTGIRVEGAVTIRAGDTLDFSLQQMRTRGLGSLLVVNDRESLVGVLTEFDLQTKVACTGTDFKETRVEEVMAPHPVVLDARSPIADAVAGMARHEISHVALVADTGKPLGMATFQDVVDYFETTLEALG